MIDWSLKYRPKNLVGLIGQDVNREILTTLVEQKKLFSAMIFYGRSGCGKTTTARILVNELDAEVIELDAASNSGVEDARNIKDIASKLALSGRRKIIIIDEAHMLSRAAWNALLKIIEEPNDKTHFIFCTTEYNAIPTTIRGRSQMFKFYSIPKDVQKQYVIDILKQEKAEVDERLIEFIIKESKGQMRDLLKTLQKAVETGITTVSQMAESLGIPDVKGMGSYLTAVLNNDSKTAVRALKDVADKTDSLLSWKARLEDLIYEILEDNYGLGELNYPLMQAQKLRQLTEQHKPQIFGKVLDYLLKIYKEETAFQVLYVLAVLGVEGC